MYVWLVIVVVVMEMVVKGCDDGGDVCVVGDGDGGGDVCLVGDSDGSDGDGSEGV